MATVLSQGAHTGTYSRLRTCAYLQAELKEFEALLWELHDSLKVKREASRSALLADLALSSPELVDALYATGKRIHDCTHVHLLACTCSHTFAVAHLGASLRSVKNAY